MIMKKDQEEDSVVKDLQEEDQHNMQDKENQMVLEEELIKLEKIKKKKMKPIEITIIFY